VSRTVTAEQRAVNRARWQRRAASWDRNAPKGASVSDDLNQAMIDAAGIAPGATVLDTAAGTGEPSISIALGIGHGGTVFATDLTARMLGAARRRAAALGLAQIRFAVADMESLPLGDGSFDAVTCRCGLMHVPDPDAAAAEAERVLKPGARAVYLVWGPAEDNTAFYVTEPVVREHFADGGPPSPRHSLGAPGTVGAILEGAGFAQVEEREISETRRVKVDEMKWLARLARNNAERLDAMSNDERAALDKAIRIAAEPYRDGDVYVIRTHARLCIGTKAG
jgi:SAM-dependent methyltransferase